MKYQICINSKSILLFVLLKEIWCERNKSEPTFTNPEALTERNEFFKFDSRRDFKVKRDASGLKSLTSKKWSHSVWLGEPLRSPRLFWNPSESSVDFNVEANTIGGIIIGFNNEDFIILWVDDVSGKAQIEVVFKILFVV